MATREELKAEALKRMEALELNEMLIRFFEKFDDLTAVAYPRGGLLQPTKEMIKLVKEAEEKFDMLVYYMIYADTSIGRLLFMLYVMNEPESWRFDWSDIKKQIPSFWVANMDEPLFSEFGNQLIEKKNGIVLIDD